MGKTWEQFKAIAADLAGEPPLTRLDPGPPTPGDVYLLSFAFDIDVRWVVAAGDGDLDQQFLLVPADDFALVGRHDRAMVTEDPRPEYLVARCGVALWVPVEALDRAVLTARVRQRDVVRIKTEVFKTDPRRDEIDSVRFAETEADPAYTDWLDDISRALDVLRRNLGTSLTATTLGPRPQSGDVTALLQQIWEKYGGRRKHPRHRRFHTPDSEFHPQTEEDPELLPPDQLVARLGELLAANSRALSEAQAKNESLSNINRDARLATRHHSTSDGSVSVLPRELFGVKGNFHTVAFVVDVKGKNRVDVKGKNRQYPACHAEVIRTWARHMDMSACALIVASAGGTAYPAPSRVFEVSENANDLAEFYSSIDRCEDNGDIRNTVRAIELAFAVPEVTCVVLLSDGFPTAGPLPVDAARQRVIELCEHQYKQHFCPVNVVGVGDCWAPEATAYLRQIASLRDGTFQAR